MKEDFIAKGWASKELLDKIYAPIGIDIQSKTVQEIAISIAGQLVQKRQEQIILDKGQEVEIIILAAGKSERMGQQKLLMPYAGSTIIENIIQKALASNAGKVKVVAGSDEAEVTEAIRHLPVTVCLNRDYENGMLSSVQCGFNSLSSTVKAGLILLGDQPMIQTWVINKLIDSYYKTGKGILIPVYEGKRGHPVLIDTRYISEINALDPAIGLRQLMEGNADDIYDIEVDTNTILKDIDTIEDYKKELT
jgi:molybdenum cofactor cytidylyltransferase